MIADTFVFHDDRGRTQRGEPGCASAKAQDEISSEDNSGTSARLSDGLLRLAGVVVQAANHACLLDLDAMQVFTTRRKVERVHNEVECCGSRSCTTVAVTTEAVSATKPNVHCSGLIVDGAVACAG